MRVTEAERPASEAAIEDSGVDEEVGGRETDSDLKCEIEVVEMEKRANFYGK